VRLRRVEGRATIALRAVHAARLRIRVQPRGGPRRALVSRHVRACHGYRVALPRGHGVATVVASVRRGAQTTARRY
jgi:hypothetical protein